MKRVLVNLGANSYTIEIDTGLLNKAKLKSKYVLITDSNVDKILDNKIKNGALFKFVISVGESSKNLKIAGAILQKLAQQNVDKETQIVGLGGGVVGDLSGFVASIYKRGVKCVHIPTTLLAMVDSSIGGKTGVNLPEGKNLIGTIHQPHQVIIDTEVLKQLPEKEIKNGLAEVIKYGITLNKDFFEYLEENIEMRDNEFYLHIIEESCKIKAQIVEQDEKEKELRKILNFGHTIGHAIETITDYKMTHGEAIAIGMVYEAKISRELGYFPKEDLEKLSNLLKKAGLPTIFNGDMSELIEIMRRDKKSKDGEIHFVLPKRIGKIHKKSDQVAFPVEETNIEKCLGD